MFMSRCSEPVPRPAVKGPLGRIIGRMVRLRGEDAVGIPPLRRGGGKDTAAAGAILGHGADRPAAEDDIAVV